MHIFAQNLEALTAPGRRRDDSTNASESPGKFRDTICKLLRGNVEVLDSRAGCKGVCMHVTACVQSLNVQSTSIFRRVVAIPGAYSRLGSGYGAEDIRSRFEQPYSEISAPPWESEACAWPGNHHGGNRFLFQPTKGVIGITYILGESF